LVSPASIGPVHSGDQAGCGGSAALRGLADRLDFNGFYRCR